MFYGSFKLRPHMFKSFKLKSHNILNPFGYIPLSVSLRFSSISLYVWVLKVFSKKKKKKTSSHFGLCLGWANFYYFLYLALGPRYWAGWAEHVINWVQTHLVLTLVFFEQDIGIGLDRIGLRCKMNCFPRTNFLWADVV